MASVERRLQRLEARTPPARDEEEVRAAACRRMSTEDLTVLDETCRLWEERGDSWDVLTEEERVAFESAWGRYEEAISEARRGR